MLSILLPFPFFNGISLLSIFNPFFPITNTFNIKKRKNNGWNNKK
jgi:hypothetical protein